MTSLRPFHIDLDYEIVTPLFLSGADPAVAELRAPSIRGAVRAWYRALDPRFRHDEVRWMGAADQPDDVGEKHTRQSPWLLRVLRAPSDAMFTLDRNEFRRFDRGTPPERTNGVLYTGFSLLDRFNQRSALAASTPSRRAVFTLRVVIPRPTLDDDADRGLPPRGLTAVLGSFWLLGHLGGLGSRARRAWGSVQLIGVRAEQAPAELRQVIQRLTPPAPTTLAAWTRYVSETLTWLRGELTGERDEAALQPGHLGDGAWIRALSAGHRDWASALNDVGARMQKFRRGEWQDRRSVGEELLRRMRKGGRPLQVTPRRAAFGLPLTFRFGITPKYAKDQSVSQLTPDTITFVPAERAADGDRRPDESLTRFPGPVSLRVIRLGTSWHGLVVRLAGAPVGTPDPGGAAMVGVAEPSRRPTVLGEVYRGKVADKPPIALPLQGEAVLAEWLQELTPASVEVRV